MSFVTFHLFQHQKTKKAAGNLPAAAKTLDSFIKIWFKKSPTSLMLMRLSCLLYTYMA